MTFINRQNLGITQHRVYAVLRNRSTGDFSFYITQQCVSVGILPSLGGINSLLGVECSSSIPLINKIPTLIMGMDVSHGSPGHANVPSVAAVLLYSYFACPLFAVVSAVRSQSPKLEMIDSLFQPVDDPVNGDNRELFVEFFKTSNARKPKQIIIFRDGFAYLTQCWRINVLVRPMCQSSLSLWLRKDTTPSCFKLRVMKMFMQEPLWTPRLYKIENTY
ncbi:BnaCnng32780D [Brassica napus]|uniref:BnaCnng32780D protein n=1 Tax=Brassica napus TaxID=3708 RepID=A0A078J3D8_BRANA|nr:BnaCnng32780D [Brassica napus]